MLTEILLDVTNTELRHVAEEVCERATSKQGVYVDAILPEMDRPKIRFPCYKITALPYN